MEATGTALKLSVPLKVDVGVGPLASGPPLAGG